VALAGCASAIPPEAVPAPTIVKTTTVRVYGTIERPGSFETPRTPGAACRSDGFDDVHENVWWWISAGERSIAGGRLGKGRVRADVNPYSNGPGPCSFPIDATVEMPAGGDVALHFVDMTVPVNRLDLMVGPVTIRTSRSGRVYLGVPGTEGIPVVPPSESPTTTGS
jgi:hypothetical protein